MTRLALGLLAVMVAALCSACLNTTGTNPDEMPPVETRPPSSVQPPASVRPPSSVPTVTRKPEMPTLDFGKSHTWRDGVRVTVGKPQTFKPSKWAVTEKSKHYVKFPITVVNKADKPIDLGWTHITVQSKNKEADQFYDSPIGLKGPPDTKVSKGRKSDFEVGFAVANPHDLTMELVLDGDYGRRRVRYST